MPCPPIMFIASSGLRHAGQGVDTGLRYILVLFLNVRPQTPLCQARRCKSRGVSARKRFEEWESREERGGADGNDDGNDPATEGGSTGGGTREDALREAIRPPVPDDRRQPAHQLQVEADGELRRSAPPLALEHDFRQLRADVFLERRLRAPRLPHLCAASDRTRAHRVGGRHLAEGVSALDRRRGLGAAQAELRERQRLV